MLTKEALNTTTIRILKFIMNYLERESHAPTQSEIARRMKLSDHRAVSYHLHRLRDAGIITLKKNKARCITIIDPRQASVLVNEKR